MEAVPELLVRGRGRGARADAGGRRCSACLVFKRRIRGPFFAILTQATAVIFVLAADRQPQADRRHQRPHRLHHDLRAQQVPARHQPLALHVAAIGLLVVLAIAMKVVRSRYGKLLQATRDSEDRVRFLGYDPAIVKTVGFVIAAGMAGLAGAIAAPVFGIVSPAQFDYVPSILMVCWVAVGGRGTLWGAVLGALVVNWARVTVSDGPSRRLAVPAGPAVRGGAGLRPRGHRRPRPRGPPGPDGRCAKRREPGAGHSDRRGRHCHDARCWKSVAWRWSSTGSRPSTGSTSPSNRASCGS